MIERRAAGRSVRFLTLAVLLAPLCGVTADGAGARRTARYERAEVLGTIQVVIEDDLEHGTWRRRVWLEEEGTGRVFRLRTPNQAPELVTGDRVRIRGRRTDKDLIVDRDDLAAMRLEATPEPAPTGFLGTVNSRSTLVLVVDFGNQDVECSTSTVSSLMYTGTRSVDGLYSEASFGQVGFSYGMGLVRRISIGASTGSCNPNSWASQADAAAWAAGVSVDAYRHKIYVLPSTVDCPWAGQGHLGCGSSCRSWIRLCDEGDLYAHELGHNLNLAHASTDTNNDGSLDCEYCDRSDVMGYSAAGWRQFNAPHKYQAGWLPDGQVLYLQPGLQGETVTLAALDADPLSTPLPQVIRIPRSDTTADAYYVSYRRRAGYDQSLSSAYAWQTNIHRWFGGPANTLLIRSLSDGEEFLDTSRGISVRQLAHDSSTATVQIELDCARAPLGVSVTPAVQPGQPGQLLQYTVQITNQDVGTCAAAHLDLAPVLPPGWAGGLGASEFTLDAGESDVTTLSAQSSLGAVAGGYGVGVDVSDATTPLHDDIATAVYEVQTPAPSQVIGIDAFVRRRTLVTLTWTESVSESAITSYNIFRDDFLIGTTQETRFIDRTAERGQIYKYYVTATNAEGFESTPGPRVIVDLTRPGNRGWLH